MERNRDKLRNAILSNNDREVFDLLSNCLDPNFEGGWPIRLAARLGFYSLVKLFVRYGANPHLLSESGASTLQLAVYSAKHWDMDKWNFLLSCCDSSQLADGAAVAIIFGNIEALRKIIATGRCNTNIPTSLTGKTLEDLGKGYKLQYLLDTTTRHHTLQVPATPSPRMSRQHRSDLRETPVTHHRNLSPSVASFFNLAATQTSLTPPRSPLGPMFSPTAQ
ncbi:uncharacterized protein LOC119834733 [Zerene cesonia]|uniref:uncharacterized protein LOC119834733 n=1 Tax=Zerene cesonia TaxID=33412 RepID=UPI0018E509BC|nr:uncharacterized protein LOC119834733 [Zerene cesonia]